MKLYTVTAQTLQAFEVHLRMEEKAEDTVRKYLRDCRAFHAFLDGRPLSKEAAIAYKQRLQDGGYAVRSINSMLASLNSLFVFLGRPDWRLKALKLQRQIYCPEEKELTKAEYARLLQTAQRQRDPRLGMIIQTICATGIRVSELSAITVAAVRAGEATVRCKGKVRTIFLVQSLRKRLLGYIAGERIREGAVFVTRSGRPVDRCNIWREMKALCSAARVDPRKVFPHNLRHLFARTFYSIEKDIAKLADILGHTSIETTRIYIVASGREHRRRMEHMHLVI